MEVAVSSAIRGLSQFWNSYGKIIVRLLGVAILVTPFVVLRLKVNDWTQQLLPGTEVNISNTLKSLSTVLLIVAIVVGIGYLIGLPIFNFLYSAGTVVTVAGVILTTVTGMVFASTFQLASERYAKNDVVEIPSKNLRGMVEDITLFNTRIRTFQNSFITISNRKLLSYDVVNHTPADFNERRTSVEILVTYESNIDKAIEVIEDGAMEAARGNSNIVSKGSNNSVGQIDIPWSPTCNVAKLGDHGILLKLWYWVEEPCSTGAIKSDIIEAIESRVENCSEVEFAYPHSHLYVDETSFDGTDGEFPISR